MTTKAPMMCLVPTFNSIVPGRAQPPSVYSHGEREEVRVYTVMPLGCCPAPLRSAVPVLNVMAV